MPGHAKLTAEVNRVMRKITVDANQAVNYFENSMYEGFEENIAGMVDSLKALLEKTRSKID